MAPIPTSFPVPPLYEPGPPHPTLPILAAHTSFTSIPCRFNKLAAHDTLPISPILPSRVESAVPRIRSATPNLRSATPSRRSTTLNPPSATANPPTVRFRAPTSSDNDSDSGDSELTTLLSDLDMDMDGSDDERIPKPQGEAGRPKRGGYTLKVALNWRAKDYKALKRSVYKAVQDHLDHTKSFKFQKESALNSVQQQVIDDCPRLNDYVDHWPFTDMLMATLKSSSAKWRKEKRMKVEGVQEANRKRKLTEAKKRK